MGVRTGKGDKGITELSFRKRVSKDSLEVHALGDLDELNSFIGLTRSKIRSRKEKALLENIQNTLFRISSEIAVGAEKRKKMGRNLGENYLCKIGTNTETESILFQLFSLLKLPLI